MRCASSATNPVAKRRGLHLDAATHTYTWQGRIVPGATEILKAMGLIRPHGTDVDLVRGQAAHRACWYQDEGDLNWAQLDPGLEGYVRAWIRCKRATGLRMHAIERSYYHPTYDYATTVDRIVTLHGRRGPLDLKTGLIEPWVALQTQAHGLAIGRYDTRWAVALSADGQFEIQEFTDHTDAAAWLGLVAAYHWTRRQR